MSTNWVQLDSSSTRHSTWLGWIPKIHNWYWLLLCGLLTNKAREFWWLDKSKTSAFSPIVASWWRSWDLCWIWQTLNAKEQHRAKNGGGIVRVQNCSNGFVKLKFYCLYTHFYEKNLLHIELRVILVLDGSSHTTWSTTYWSYKQCVMETKMTSIIYLCKSNSAPLITFHKKKLWK